MRVSLVVSFRCPPSASYRLLGVSGASFTAAALEKAVEYYRSRPAPLSECSAVPGFVDRPVPSAVVSGVRASRSGERLIPRALGEPRWEVTLAVARPAVLAETASRATPSVLT